MLTLNLLNLLEKSEKEGRIIFNVTEGGKIFWDDLQMKNKWSYEDGIRQAMVAKRMFLVKLHNLYRIKNNPKLSFIGFQIPKTVWSNQINIIPASMRIMATIMKCFGTFISIERGGEIIAPLFTEGQGKSLMKSGKFLTWKKNEFVEIKEEQSVLYCELQNRLWEISIKLCDDERIEQISGQLHSHAKGGVL